jgi:hypothetical protein
VPRCRWAGGSAAAGPPPPPPILSRSVLEGESLRTAKRPADSLDSAAAEKLRKQADEDGVIVSNGRRTIAIQTMYRESEAQTDAYTPEYVLSVAEPAPEILGLAHLKAGVCGRAGRCFPVGCWPRRGVSQRACPSLSVGVLFTARVCRRNVRLTCLSLALCRCVVHGLHLSSHCAARQKPPRGSR